MGTIKVGGKIHYRIMVDVLNDLFGCGYGGWQRGSWKSPTCPPGSDCEMWVWFPHVVYVLPNGCPVGDVDKSSRKWKNYADKDFKWIEEIAPEGRLGPAMAKTGHQRIVFANEVGKEGYRFLGVYKFERKGDRPNSMRFKRIADEVDLTPYCKR